MNKNLQNKNSGYKELKERYSGAGVKTSFQNLKGDVLKKSREAQGFSLESVHEATKIPLDALKAIEEGYKIGNVSLYYIKGFVKIYAKYLGVDIYEVMDREFSRAELPKVVKQDFGDFDLKQWVLKILTKKNKKRMVVVLSILIGIWLLGRIFAFVSHQKPRENVLKEQTVSAKKIIFQKEENKKQKPASKKEAKAGVSKDTKLAISENKSAELPIDNSKVAQSQAKDMVMVVVRAKSGGWLNVKADGEIVFQGTFKVGSVETWMAKEKIEISGRHIGQLEFEVNGKLIGSLGREDRQAKTVIITKNGLSVTK